MTSPYLDPDSARWARARDDYRAGASAAEVCARHDIARSTFYVRANAERWRRADLASANAGAAAEVDDFDASAPRGSAFQMAELAHRRLSHAVEKGRLREALGWARLAKELRTLTPEEEGWSWRKLHREAKAGAGSLEVAASPGVVDDPAPVSADDATAAAVSASFAALDAAPPPAAASAEPAQVQPPSPAEPLDQAFDVVEKPPLSLDSPDTFSALNAILPPELFAELTQDMAALRAGDPAHADDWAAWEGMRLKLAAARPDLPWWGGPSSGNGANDEAWEGDDAWPPPDDDPDPGGRNAPDRPDDRP